MSRADEIKKLIYENQRRVQILKEKEARFGISTPPEILLEIEDIEAKIEELQRELSLLSQDSQFTFKTKQMEQIEEGKVRRGVKKQADNWPQEQAMPSIGLVTALPKEFAAVKAILEDARDVTVPGRGAGRRYLLGNITTIDGTTHALVLAWAGMGTNSATARAARILDHFSTVNSIIMVGIAGGIPYPEKPDEHVRLGDVVVSNMGGVVQYDFVKEEMRKEEVITIDRHPPRPPSATLLEAVDLLEAYEIEGKRPWLKFISQIMDRLNITRPPGDTDILVSSKDPNQKINHPDDPKRIKGQPRIFKGPIASANILLKNPLKRDELRNKFGVKAVEMEGSGIADAAWNYEVGYLIVRGICDYCDSKKGDEWQEYAAVVAAGYVGALLESIPGTDSNTEITISAQFSYPGTLPQKMKLVEALLECPSISDRHTRDAIIDDLPKHIKSNIRRSSKDRDDIRNIVTTCLDYPNGLLRLLDVVRFYERDSLPMRNIDQLIS